MDLFGIKARRQARLAKKQAEEKAAEQKRLEDAKKAREAYQERKKMIEDWLKLYYKRQTQQAIETLSLLQSSVYDKNNVCPKCKSKNVINHIKRVKGELHGKGSGHASSHSSSGLFLSSHVSDASFHSKIDGELDTYPVNKCKDCGNEWSVEPQPKVSDCEVDDFSTYTSVHPGYMFRRVEEWLDMEYDPYDVKETANSLEEKRENLAKKSSGILDCYKNTPRFMMDYALYMGIHERTYITDRVDKRFGDVRNTDRYSYEMPDDIWEIVKKLVGWAGEETTNDN